MQRLPSFSVVIDLVGLFFKPAGLYRQTSHSGPLAFVPLQEGRPVTSRFGVYPLCYGVCPEQYASGPPGCSWSVFLAVTPLGAEALCKEEGGQGFTLLSLFPLWMVPTLP